MNKKALFLRRSLSDTDINAPFRRVRGQVPEPSSDWTDVRKRTGEGNNFRLLMDDYSKKLGEMFGGMGFYS